MGAWDTPAVPFFAFIVSLWATIYLELWKRHQSKMQVHWDVHEGKDERLRRPFIREMREMYTTTHTAEASEDPNLVRLANLVPGVDANTIRRDTRLAKTLAGKHNVFGFKRNIH